MSGRRLARPPVYRQDMDCYCHFFLTLFCAYGGNVIASVLLALSDGIAMVQVGIKQSSHTQSLVSPRVEYHRLRTAGADGTALDMDRRECRKISSGVGGIPQQTPS